jgi:hypothetical protein
LNFERAVFGCAAFNSPKHEKREVVLAVGGTRQDTAEILDYSQSNSKWEESKDYSLILHCLKLNAVQR